MDYIANARKAIIGMEEKVSSRFECKPTMILEKEGFITFNGAKIEICEHQLVLSQPYHIEKLEFCKEKDVLKTRFVARSARDAYIASIARRDLTFGFSQASVTIIPSTDSAKMLNNTIKNCEKKKNIKLKFMPLDRTFVRLAVFSDASFASS